MLRSGVRSHQVPAEEVAEYVAMLRRAVGKGGKEAQSVNRRMSAEGRTRDNRRVSEKELLAFVATAAGSRGSRLFPSLYWRNYSNGYPR